MPHMPATGVSGVDLYMKDADGQAYGVPENILLEIRYVIHMIILLILVSRIKEMNSVSTCLFIME